MHLIAILVMIAGVIGAFLFYLGIISVLSIGIWAGIAVVGMVVTVLTRRPGD